jgi:hypothetical protein
MGDLELRSIAIVLANDLYALTGPSGGIAKKAVRYSGAHHIPGPMRVRNAAWAVTGLSPPIIPAATDSCGHEHRACLISMAAGWDLSRS